MKKFLIVFLLFLLLLAAFSVGSFAEGGGEYLISKADGVYTLSVYDGGEPQGIRSSESLTEILTELSCVGGRPHAVLDSIVYQGSLTLPEGEYTLSGSLTVTEGGVLSVPEGCRVSLSSLTLGFSGGGYLFIKGAEVSFLNSRIISDAERAVLLNYSSHSRFEFLSGEISGSFGEAAVTVESGALSVSGGSIVNLGGAAILTETGLTLSGTPRISGIATDIKTSHEISLSIGGEYYLGEVSVAYDGLFSDGTLTKLFYNASAEAVRGIRVFDRVGEEYNLTYFDESRHTEEKCFAAVYLPYSLKYFVSDELYLEENYIYGETPSPTLAPERLGYFSLGWYGSDGRSYDPEPLFDNLSLYAHYELSAPRFSISSLSFTYDGEAHALSFDSLTHPLLDSGAYVSYEWKRDGETVSRAPSPSFTDVNDSGEYSVTLTLHFEGDTTTVKAESILVTVRPATVKAPVIPTAAYTGARLYPDVLPSSLYSFEEVFGVGAGSYPVLFTLTDSENYRWESVNTDTLSVNFVIKKAENTWVEEPKISDTYTGLSPRIQAKALFGEVRVGYCVSELLPYSDTVPTAPGDYYAVLYVEGTEDYSSLESPPLKFSISEDRVTSLKIESYASLCEYSAFSRFSADGLVLIASYRSGREEPVSADKISISYNGKDSLRVGDRSVTLSYGGCYISHPVSVLPIEYDLSGIRFFDTEYVYDGLYHTVDSVLPNVIGLDGLPLRYAVKGGGTDSGVYGVTLAFFSDSKNYKLPEARYATVTVLPMSVLLSWSGSSFTYDGTAKLPTASYTDVLGVRRYPTVTGARCNAGEGYIAKAAADGANYVFENPECEYSIAKADYDLSGVYWSQSSFDYDGERHAVELFGLPSGVAVVGYTDASHTEAGIYTARAALEYDSENYNEPSPITHKWVIYPREYDLSGFSFSDSEAVFDGEAHYPTLFGSMPTGLDGSVLSYAFSGGAMHVDEGRVAVSVRFFTDSKNYVAPEPAVYYVTVLPRSISVTWRNGEFIYDGREKLPHATAAECAVRVTGAGVSAGFYKAYAESLDSDYRIANPEYEYEIKKAENTWQNAPTVGDIYEGDELRLKGSSLSGKACFRFFSSESPELEIAAPTRPGRYYAIAYVTESENYLGLESAPIPFEIIEVFATDFVVSLSGGTYTALSSLSAENTAAYIVYNNGERRAVDFSLLSVEYQSGSILHFGDSEVAVSYLGFRRVIPVSVVRRNYDLSEVRWQDTDTVYDGEVKCPTLIGLPDGVSVVRYEGYGSAAGEYTVRAYLSYDAENYNAPCIEDTRLTIRRRTVVPTLYAAVYDGTAHIPVSDSPLYSVINPTPQRLAGSYDVTVRLTDPENYTFGTSDEATVVFTVLPRILSLELTDRYVYLFESEAPFTVSAPEGALPADEVEILAKIEGERVIYSLNNPNYTLQKSEGRVLRLSYPSPEFTWTVLFIILFLLLIILGVLVMFYRYDDIKGAVAALRCKRKMRAVLEREKREEENNHGKPDTPTFTAEDNPGKPDTPTFTAEDNLGKPDTPTFTAEDNLGKSGTPTSAEEPFGSDAVLSFNEESCEPLAESDTVLSIDAERADELITDSLAKDLLKRPREFVLTEGKRRSVINVDTLSNSFRFGDRVDVNVLKEKKLIPYDTAYLKVLARGAIDKPLTVRANDFSLAAIKMIALTGGEAIKVVTVKEKRKR